MRSSELSQVQLTDLRRDVQQLIEQLREDVALARQQQRAELSLVDASQVMDIAEQASSSAMRLEAFGHIQQLEGEIRTAEHALQRFETGFYGECESCGEVIELNRLKANPVAVLCLSCQASQEA